MKKRVYLFSFLLTSCYYHDGCMYTPQMVNCYVDKGETWPAIAHYQKPNTIGHTDSAQRWKDAVACGAKYGDIKLRHSSRDDLEKFQLCMKSKGYHKYWPAECGYMNPKWDEGKCNL
ncbi:hypothetical protein EV697_10812 [Bisgaardia hudsonensis]|uniref:Uncharacterized protein n=1 Tax=Bisgaardia hudsonensis TaxID=109472 RepID=A0A4R2MX03_9PAST|nr:hypothetical protein [Bisgaardia hudsonensis]QLB12875.1 hypothetical protein A6A11_04260 [Bisgaardia hudsonensis]TCP11289.1 hypothetical protein EV697_10812 [Bisgaardia hudsonensis]